MTTLALINTASGSVPADARTALHDAWGQYGVNHIELVTGETLTPALRSVMVYAPDRLIVWGGDGTLACALNEAGADGPEVLCLPGGTMNLLPKRIHGEDVQATDLLALPLDRFHSRSIAAGQVGDKRFYVAALIGRLAGLADSREGLRRGEPVTALGEMLVNEVFDVDAHITLTTDTDHRPIAANGVGLFVGGPPDDAFSVGYINPQSPVDIVRLALAAAVQGWRDVDDISQLTARQLVLTPHDDRPLHYTLDGEKYETETTLEFRFVPAAAQVLTAAP